MSIIKWLNSLFGKCPNCGKPYVSFDEPYEEIAKGNFPAWCTCSKNENIKRKIKDENKKGRN